MIDIRAMLQEETLRVRELYAMCYPGRATQPPGWYFVNPTFVALDGSRVVGFTSCNVTLLPGYGQVMYGKDMCVHPEYRGRGIAKTLHEIRLALGREVGARIFMGVAFKDNVAMGEILKKAGAHECLTVEDGTLYTGLIPELDY